MTARTSRASVVARLGSALLVGVALLAACESKLPTSAEIDGMTASSATKRAAEVTGLDTSKVYYVVDDKSVSKQEAEKLTAENIATIEVQGGKTSPNGSVVRIRTAQKPTTISDSLARIEVGNGGATIRKVGPDGATGGRITATNVGVLRRASGGDSTGGVMINSSKTRTPFNGLLVIDGVESKAGTDLNTLSREKIESIEVIKGASATALYSNPLAVNGVIVVKTKK